MNTCKTCVHWGVDPDSELAENRELRDGYRECYADVFRESGQWYHREYTAHGCEYTDKTETDRVCYSYDEGGWFQTGPDFGCVHHKAKE